jgi:hypothetical protein
MSTENVMHTNPMGGKSFFPNNPILKLELMLYSSFLHEPTFYNPKEDKSLVCNDIKNMLDEYLLFPGNSNKSRQLIFYETAHDALDFDFKKTLELAVRARHEFYMRKSPCELLAIAAQHPKRKVFNKENFLFFREIVQKVCILPNDMISILDSWKSLKGSKSGFPTFLKRAFRDIVGTMSPYHMNKYRRAVIDVVRISHAKGNEYIKELMTTGKLKMKSEDRTWEELRSQGQSWTDVLHNLEWRMPHMAALRNIRGFAIHVRDENYIKKYCAMLEDGVVGGKQFPFRYLVAHQSILDSVKVMIPRKSNNNKNYYQKGIRKVDREIILKCLENCIQKSIENHPKLLGDTIILSDNSGSAWRTCTSEYGTQSIAEIGNISALITGLSCKGRATIGLFGDRLLEYEVDKNVSFLENYEKIKELVGVKGCNVGGCTENGIWLFFKRSMKEPLKYTYENFFCYSDQQAGHGGLYGNDHEMSDNWMWIYGSKTKNSKYIHVPKLIENYRQSINPKLNVFTIQTAGYNDSIMPQSMYRATMFSSWTGREVVYAEKVIKLWNELDAI